jgi:hypothetical protein
MILTDAG